ncbi:MAG: response regulator [Nitrospiraceae bacterium]|nr:response regulator [Nitrospiraceae bacterium]
MSESAKKVIIADDHASSVMYLAVLMRRMGFQVVPAKNGVEVLKLMKMSPPDLVMLDYTMPVMDGLTTLRHIKSDRQLKDIPVIMVTAHSHRSGVDDFMKTGAAGYITKPINIKQLHSLLQDCVSYSGGKKRVNLRTTIEKSVSVSVYGLSRNYPATALSERGVYLRTKEPFPIGTELDVILSLTTTVTLTLRGIVIYHRDVFRDSIDPGMAIEFRDLSPRETEILSAYITHALAGDLLKEQDEGILSDKA